jgi:hypothetical protein
MENTCFKPQKYSFLLVHTILADIAGTHKSVNPVWAALI